MNLEEVIKKIESGTAGEEEKAFFSAEIEKLRRIRDILDMQPKQSVIAEADTETVLRARKHFNKKTTIRIIAVTVASLLAIAAITCGIIFIPSCTSAARSQKIERDEAVELAYEYLGEYLGEDTSNYIIHDCDKELRIPGRLNEAIFVYDIDLRTPDGLIEYELDVSTKSGFVSLEDVDRRG